MVDTKKVRAPSFDGEMAKAFAGEEFERRHPRETWPEWLRPCTVVSYGKDLQGQFVVSFAVSYKEPLRADEHWEERNGQRRIVRVDPRTLERFVVSRTPRRVVVYFKARVDPATANVVVLADMDLSGFIGDELDRG
jgi:hypothetical protein